MKGSKRVFATSLEVHYPPELCAAIVRAFLTRLQVMGVKPSGEKPSNAASQQFSGRQPVTAKFPPFVLEFRCFLQFFFDVTGEVCWPSSAAVPSHYKLLHKFKLGNGSVEEKVERLRNFCKAIDTELVVEKSQFGQSFHEFRIFGSHGSHGICASSEEFAASTEGVDGHLCGVERCCGSQSAS